MEQRVGTSHTEPSGPAEHIHTRFYYFFQKTTLKDAVPVTHGKSDKSHVIHPDILNWRVARSRPKIRSGHRRTITGSLLPHACLTTCRRSIFYTSPLPKDHTQHNMLISPCWYENETYAALQFETLISDTANAFDCVNYAVLSKGQCCGNGSKYK
jgi:hypothetical protein